MLLKKGMYNNDGVYQLQKDLVRLGYNLSVDGDFGSGTEKAVKSFQKKYKLGVDGIAGKATIGKIIDLLSYEGSVPHKEDNKFTLVNTDIPHHFEGCKLKAYLCPAGIWTIGWGSTGSHVYKGLVITQEQADELFIKDTERFVNAVNNKVKTPITQYQFDALVSFVYNIGIGAFGRSTLLKKLNRSDYKGAIKEFLKWNKGGGKVLEGLTRRRKSESYYFETGKISFFE